MEASELTKKSCDKILEEIRRRGTDESDEHKNVKHKPRSTNSTGRRGTGSSKSRPMEKILKRTFAQHCLEIQDIEKVRYSLVTESAIYFKNTYLQRHPRNIRGINHIMKKKSKALFSKCQSELVESKLAVDEFKKGTEKLKMELRKNRISKYSKSAKISSLLQHFKNSTKSRNTHSGLPLAEERSSLEIPEDPVIPDVDGLSESCIVSDQTCAKTEGYFLNLVEGFQFSRSFMKTRPLRRGRFVRSAFPAHRRLRSLQFDT